MHKDDTVAKMDIDSSCKAKKLKIINKDLLPIGGQMNEMKFSEWWFDRAVPKTRAGFNDAIKKFNCTTSNQMLIDNLALKLLPITFAFLAFSKAFSTSFLTSMNSEYFALISSAFSYLTAVGIFSR